MTTLALTIPEVVATTKMSRTAVYKALQNNTLIGRKSGRRTLILATDLQRYMESLPAYAAEA